MKKFLLLLLIPLVISCEKAASGYAVVSTKYEIVESGSMVKASSDIVAAIQSCNPEGISVTAKNTESNKTTVFTTGEKVTLKYGSTLCPQTITQPIPTISTIIVGQQTSRLFLYPRTKQFQIRLRSL